MPHFQYPPPDRISCNTPAALTSSPPLPAFSIHHRIELAATAILTTSRIAPTAFSIHHRIELAATVDVQENVLNLPNFQYPPPDRISCNSRFGHRAASVWLSFQYPPPDRISCNDAWRTTLYSRASSFSIHHRIELAATQRKPRFPTHPRANFQYPPPDRISCNTRSPVSIPFPSSSFSIHHRIELAATLFQHRQNRFAIDFQYPPPDRISCNVSSSSKSIVLSGLSVSTTGSN